MAHYIATTPKEREEMLAAVGVESLSQLFLSVPEAARAGTLDLPEGRSEAEVLAQMETLAAGNHVFASVFRGAGSYRHYIPAIVGQVASKEAFRTAYTPYQPEISQGVLQAIFEYQTMICELTGMAAANASVYDGAWAAAEAVGMCREKKRDTVLLSQAIHPHHGAVLRTYCGALGLKVGEIPAPSGVTDPMALAQGLSDQVCAVYAQSPNFWGQLEDAGALARAAHDSGAKLILGVHPIASVLLKAPGDCGVDIAVGDGQPLGLPMSFGGPSLGFMATNQTLMRKLPGRIVGQTTDQQGRRAFVLTLQAREQHIRREKAGSNICSNQALCALTAGAYLAAMGPEGLLRVARSAMASAAYLRERLCALPGFDLVFHGPFFNEFVTTCPLPVERLMQALQAADILGGLPLEGPLSGSILWCATECNDQADIDRMIGVIAGEVEAWQAAGGRNRKDDEPMLGRIEGVVGCS